MCKLCEQAAPIDRETARRILAAADPSWNKPRAEDTPGYQPYGQPPDPYRSIRPTTTIVRDQAGVPDGYKTAMKRRAVSRVG